MGGSRTISSCSQAAHLIPHMELISMPTSPPSRRSMGLMIAVTSRARISTASQTRTSRRWRISLLYGVSMARKSISTPRILPPRRSRTTALPTLGTTTERLQQSRQQAATTQIQNVQQSAPTSASTTNAPPNHLLARNTNLHPPPASSISSLTISSPGYKPTATTKRLPIDSYNPLNTTRPHQTIIDDTISLTHHD